MIGALLNKLTKSYEFKRQGIEQTEQWKDIQSGDTVEYAVQFSEGIAYKVESIDKEQSQARIRRLNDQGSTEGMEAYTVALHMLRKP